MNTHYKVARATTVFVITGLLGAGLSGCSGMTRQNTNTAIGAAAGAVAGSVLTGGSAVGTVGGAVVGGVIGNKAK